MSWQFPWIWNSVNAISNNMRDGYQFGDFTLGYAGFTREGNLESQANAILGNSRQEYLDDRAHTEAREDSSLDRLVEAYRRNGLNPAMLAGATSGLGSSASNVGANTVANKLQVLGYILDLKNLDLKNRQVTNNAIGNIIKAFK